jgi:hypothetical protein
MCDIELYVRELHYMNNLLIQSAEWLGIGCLWHLSDDTAAHTCTAVNWSMKLMCFGIDGLVERWNPRVKNTCDQA